MMDIKVTMANKAFGKKFYLQIGWTSVYKRKKSCIGKVLPHLATGK